MVPAFGALERDCCLAAAKADYNSRSFLSQLFFSSLRTRTNSVFFQSFHDTYRIYEKIVFEKNFVKVSQIFLHPTKHIDVGNVFLELDSF